MLSRIQIDRSSLLGNLSALSALSLKAQDDSNICMPVLKANAYGHGLQQVYQCLSQNRTPPPWIGINYLSEASQLRGFGYQGRLLVVGPNVDLADTAKVAKELDLDIQAYDPEQWEMFSAYLPADRLHLKVDTGLGRQGVAAEEWYLHFKSSGWQGKVGGMSMHFANVEDVQQHDYASMQRQQFSEAIKGFLGLGVSAERIHCNASSSHILFRDSESNLSRMGISLYGSWPSQATKLSALGMGITCELKPALSWESSVAQTKKVEAGASIGYGCTYTANAPMSLAIIPVGYNEGYCREYSQGQPYVLIREKRCPLVGRISMNMFVVDVTHLAKEAALKQGEQVTLIGKQGTSCITAEMLADWGQTIQYQVFTRLHPDIPRTVVG